MAKALVMTESGDWCLVPWDKRAVFWKDELEDRVDYDYTYVGSPSSIKIKEYDIG